MRSLLKNPIDPSHPPVATGSIQFEFNQTQLSRRNKTKEGEKEARQRLDNRKKAFLLSPLLWIAFQIVFEAPISYTRIIPPSLSVHSTKSLFYTNLSLFSSKFLSNHDAHRSRLPGPRQADSYESCTKRRYCHHPADRPATARATNVAPRRRYECWLHLLRRTLLFP